MITNHRLYKFFAFFTAVCFLVSCTPLVQTSAPSTADEISESGPASEEIQSAAEATSTSTTATSGEAEESSTTSTKTPIILDAGYAPAFAEYTIPEFTLPESFEGGYELPLNLASVQGMDNFALSQQQKQLLSQNGFVAAAPGSRDDYMEFYQIYEAYRYDDQPLFATTDAVFHVYHLLFDKILRDLESEYFIPILDDLTLAMLDASQEQYETLKGTKLEEPALRNLAFFSVGAQLLEIGDSPPAEVVDLVQAEMALIDAHSMPGESPIWYREDLDPDERLIEDYTQYVPRGHYTRSDTMKRYFRAMMWYGRLTFRLRDGFETQRALLLTHALRETVSSNGEAASTLWANVFEPVGFLVGKADDPTFYEYRIISESVFGEAPDLMAYADEGLLDEFIQQAQDLPAPQVNSMWVWIWEDVENATKGFRFMGQRFTLDAYLFGQLIYRNVGTDSDPRGLPKGLDVFAAMGSEEAYTLLDEMGETEYLNYDKQMNKVKGEVSALEMDSWTQNVYWTWLYAFHPLIEAKDERYPAFMQTRAWAHKDLQTSLGSWTELKHDTILYAKQVMAEMGGGGPDETIMGYVEPNPLAFARLFGLAKMTYDGLETRNLLDDNTASNLLHLMDMLEFLTRCAEKELHGEMLSEEDYWRIQFFGGELEVLTLAAADTPEEGEGGRSILQDQRSALIADVATGFGEALEEAVGNPIPIYVVLPDEPWRVAIGAVFSYYEFSVSADQRMTNEAWYEMLDSGNAPAQPAWTDSFIIP